MGFSHWDLFRDIETDFLEHTRTIGYTSQYYSVHTPKLAELILTCCSAFETTAALLCKAVDSGSPCKGLDVCRGPITKRFPNFTATKVVLPSYVMSLAPWSEWTEQGPPKWWTQGYLPLVRDREANKRAGNYWNALYAVAGLFCGILHYHWELFQGAPVDPLQAPEVFAPKNPPGFKPAPGSWSYSLPDS